MTGSSHSLTNFSPFSPTPRPGNHYFALACVSLSFLDSTYMCDHTVFVFLCLTSVSSSICFSSVQFTQSCSTLCNPMDCIACQASLSITNSQSLLKLMSIESVMPSSHLILCQPFSSCLQSFPASGSFQMSQFFASGPEYWSFSFSISPSNEYSGLISFRMDWLDLLAVQETLKSLLQHHSSKSLP